MQQSIPVCSLCHKQTGLRICKSCGLGSPVHYCYECDYQIHSASPASLHIRDPASLERSRKNLASPIYIRDERAQDSILGKTANYTQTYVEQLKAYYRKEREEYEERIRSLEKAHANVKESLEYEIETLKSRIEQVDRESKEKMQELNYKNMSKLKELMREKDGLIESLHSKISELKEVLAEEQEKTAKAREELLNLKLTYNNEQATQAAKLREKEIEVIHNQEEFERKLLEIEEKHEADREILRSDYNKLINEFEFTQNKLANRAKAGYDKKKQELQMEIENKDKEIAELRKEIYEVKTSSTIKYEAAVKENAMAQENLKASKRLCELYTADNESLQINVGKLEKEIKLLKNEAQFLESENKRLTSDNEELNKKLSKMGKAVYGKPKL